MAKKPQGKQCHTDGIPSGYELWENGIFFRKDEALIYICSPIKVIALTRDNTNRGWESFLRSSTLTGTFIDGMPRPT